MLIDRVLFLTFNIVKLLFSDFKLYDRFFLVVKILCFYKNFSLIKFFIIFKFSKAFARTSAIFVFSYIYIL
jgi:hypothetical protein